ncbi:MAG: dihydrodipicolinate synthase, partial [Rhizobacter sp.]|nr:dihydrodipicolinate synthase [Rhizobacter sp.]
MSRHPLHGVTVATVLPFNSDATIDWASFERLLDYCSAPEGIAAVFVNGHAGESSALTDAERIGVIRFARERIRREQALVAGLVATSVDDAVRQARLSEQAGADVLTVFPLVHVDQHGDPQGDALVAAQLAHVEAIGESVELPLAIFQYPIQARESYATSTLEAFARLPYVIGVKEGSDSMTVYEDNLRALHAVKPDMAVLPSNFDWFLPQLAVGGDGILSGLASLVPQGLSDLWTASQADDLVAMRRINDQLFPLVRAIYALPRSDMYARIKVALHAAGVIATLKSRTSKTLFDEKA